MTKVASKGLATPRSLGFARTEGRGIYNSSGCALATRCGNIRDFRRGIAFTLTELLVVIAIIGVLSALVVPAFNQANQKVATVGCLNNLKQLQACFHLYVLDNSDVMPPNKSYDSWCQDHAKTDTNTLDLQKGVFFPYARSIGIYHCPADKSQVEISPVQFLPRLRNRSYNMSQSVDGNSEYVEGLLNNAEVPSWKKLAQISTPPPSCLFVFIDEHPKTLDSSQFRNPVGWRSMWGDYWIDYPADRHNQGACLSFADGHAERWRWDFPKRFFFYDQWPTPPEMPDYRRITNAMRLWPN